MFIFGGFSRDIFNDIRVLDFNFGKWKAITNSGPYIPEGRFDHSIVSYDNQLFVFGGAGHYIKTLKRRICYNDMKIFDIASERWSKEGSIEGAPAKRAAHATAAAGCMMVVHGGYNSEHVKTLEDLKVFDMELCKWVETKVYQNETRIDNMLFGESISKETLNLLGSEQGIGKRQSHSMVAIFDKEYYSPMLMGKKSKRAMFFRKREWDADERNEGKAFVEGFYLFGGITESRVPRNDIWIVEPYYEENEKMLTI